MTEQRRPRRALLPLRLALGAAGVLLGSYGAYRILAKPKLSRPLDLMRWLVGSVVIHDGVLVPFTLLVGLVLTRLIPARARRYVQGTAIAIAVLIPPVLLEIHRRGSQPAGKALEGRNYAANFALVAGVIAAVGLISYLIRRYRDSRASAAVVRSPEVASD